MLGSGDPSKKQTAFQLKLFLLQTGFWKSRSQTIQQCHTTEFHTSGRSYTANLDTADWLTQEFPHFPQTIQELCRITVASSNHAQGQQIGIIHQDIRLQQTCPIPQLVQNKGNHRVCFQCGGSSDILHGSRQLFLSGSSIAAFHHRLVDIHMLIIPQTLRNLQQHLF